MTSLEAINKACAELHYVLATKNRLYGDSAFNPIRLFASANAEEQLNVRIDDKLSRLARGNKDDTEDSEFDLLGYLLLKRALRIYNGASTRLPVLPNKRLNTGQEQEPECQHQ